MMLATHSGILGKAANIESEQVANFTSEWAANFRLEQMANMPRSAHFVCSDGRAPKEASDGVEATDRRCSEMAAHLVSDRLMPKN